MVLVDSWDQGALIIIDIIFEQSFSFFAQKCSNSETTATTSLYHRDNMGKIKDAINDLDHIWIVVIILFILLVVWLITRAAWIEAQADKLLTAFLTLVTSGAAKQAIAQWRNGGKNGNDQV